MALRNPGPSEPGKSLPEAGGEPEAQGQMLVRIRRRLSFASDPGSKVKELLEFQEGRQSELGRGL